MSDLAATGCGSNDCGCSNNRSGCLFGNGDMCSWIWIILLFSLFNNNGCGCNSSTFSNNSSCDWLIIILLLSCFCGNEGSCGCC